VVDEARRGLNEYPESSHILLQLGYAYQRLEQSDKAIEIYSKCLEQDADMSEAHEYLASIYFDQGEEKLAARHIKAALKLEPEKASIHAKASMIFSSKFPGISEKHLQKARELDPFDSATKSADAYMSVMSLKFGHLRKILVRNMEDDPDSPRSMAGMGFVEISYGNYDKAIPLLQNAYVHEPDEDTLDAWIDARIAKSFPFNIFIRLHVLSYPFGPTIQCVFLMLILLFGWSLPFHKFHSAYESWIQIAHIVTAIYLSTIYLIKYPIQFYYRLRYHSETNIFTHRNALKLTLFLATIVYWILLVTERDTWVSLASFELMYAVAWHAVKTRTLISTKVFMGLLYLISWISFVIVPISTSNGLEINKLYWLPAVLGWAALLLLMDPTSKFERWWRRRNGENLTG